MQLRVCKWAKRSHTQGMLESYTMYACRLGRRVKDRLTERDTTDQYIGQVSIIRSMRTIDNHWHHNCSFQTRRQDVSYSFWFKHGWWASVV